MYWLFYGNPPKRILDELLTLLVTVTAAQGTIVFAIGMAREAGRMIFNNSYKQSNL